MNYPFFLARRLSLSSSGRKSSPAVKVASAAVALSIAVMMASIAVVTGFREEITRKVVGFNSDLTVTVDVQGEGQGNILTLHPSLKALLDTIPYIGSYGLQVSVPAVAKIPDDFKGLYLRSASDATTRDFLSTSMEEGSLPSLSPDSVEANPAIAISRLTADKLHLKTGDRLDVYFFTDDVRARRMTVSGIYNSHFDSYDDVIAYAPIETIREVTGLDADQGSSLKITLTDFSDIDEKALRLQKTLDKGVGEGFLFRQYDVSTVLTAGASYFQWLDLLNTNVAVILTLMIAVGCVTLVGGMLMIILDKKRFIGLLKALGAPTRRLRKVFIYLALRVAVQGLVIGNIVAFAILWAQSRWHFLHLDPESYYIDFVPVRLDWADCLTLNVCVLVIVWLVLILPSRFVAGISPSETLKAE